MRAERSNLIGRNCLKSGDCFVASLLAMTGEKTFYESVKIKSDLNQPQADKVPARLASESVAGRPKV